MARKQYKEAAKTAIIIANEEQVNGTYLCKIPKDAQRCSNGFSYFRKLPKRS